MKRLNIFLVISIFSVSLYGSDIILGTISKLKWKAYSAGNYIASFLSVPVENTNRLYASQYTNIYRTYNETNFGPYLLCPQGWITNEAPWTITLWFRSPPGPYYPDDWKGLIHIYGEGDREYIAVGSSDYTFELNLKSWWYTWEYARDHYGEGAFSYQDGNWHFITLTCNGSDVQLWMNTTNYLTNSLESGNGFLGNGFHFCSGIDADFSPESPKIQWVCDSPMDIDQICIFNYVLDYNTITSLWNNGMGVKYSATNSIFNGCIACWDFDDFTNSLTTNHIPNMVPGGVPLLFSTNLGEIKVGGIP